MAESVTIRITSSANSFQSIRNFDPTILVAALKQKLVLLVGSEVDNMHLELYRFVPFVDVSVSKYVYLPAE